MRVCTMLALLGALRISDTGFNPEILRVVSVYRAEFFVGADQPFPFANGKSVLMPRERVSGYAGHVLLERPNLVVESCTLAKNADGQYTPPPMKWEGKGNRKERCIQYGKPLIWGQP